MQINIVDPDTELGIRHLVAGLEMDQHLVGTAIIELGSYALILLAHSPENRLDAIKQIELNIASKELLNDIVNRLLPTIQELVDKGEIFDKF